jgi:hypothetical protein
VSDERFVHYFRCAGCGQQRRQDEAEHYHTSCSCGMHAHTSGPALLSQFRLLIQGEHFVYDRYFKIEETT